MTFFIYKKNKIYFECSLLFLAFIKVLHACLKNVFSISISKSATKFITRSIYRAMSTSMSKSLITCLRMICLAFVFILLHTSAYKQKKFNVRTKKVLDESSANDLSRYVIIPSWRHCDVMKLTIFQK